MGSSASKQRRNRQARGHLPKVGTPVARARQRDTRLRQVFGSNSTRVLLVVLVVMSLVGLVAVVR